MNTTIINHRGEDIAPQTSPSDEIIKALESKIEGQKYSIIHYRNMISEFQDALVEAVVCQDIPREVGRVFADIFGMSPTRTVSWSAEATIQGTMQVDLFDDNEDHQQKIECMDISVDSIAAEDYDVTNIDIYNVEVRDEY